jgi:hypothetical protein
MRLLHAGISHGAVGDEIYRPIVDMILEHAKYWVTLIEAVDIGNTELMTTYPVIRVPLERGQVNQVRKVEISVARAAKLGNFKNYVPSFRSGMYHGGYHDNQSKLSSANMDRSFRGYGSLLRLKRCSSDGVHTNDLQTSELDISADHSIWKLNRGSSRNYDIWRYSLPTEESKKWMQSLKGGDSIYVTTQEAFSVQGVALFSNVGIRVFVTLI